MRHKDKERLGGGGTRGGRGERERERERVGGRVGEGERMEGGRREERLSAFREHAKNAKFGMHYLCIAAYQPHGQKHLPLSRTAGKRYCQYTGKFLLALAKLWHTICQCKLFLYSHSQVSKHMKCECV